MCYILSIPKDMGMLMILTIVSLKAHIEEKINNFLISVFGVMPQVKIMFLVVVFTLSLYLHVEPT